MRYSNEVIAIAPKAGMRGASGAVSLVHYTIGPTAQLWLTGCVWGDSRSLPAKQNPAFTSPTQKMKAVFGPLHFWSRGPCRALK